MNSSAAGTKATTTIAARLARTGARAAATLLAAGVLALTAQGTAQAAEPRPAAQDRTAVASATLPQLPHLPALPGGGILGPVVDTLDGNHDWKTTPRD